MSFWGIIAIVLAAIVLLIVIICLLPVYVYVYYDEAQGLQLRYRLLWMVFGEVPNPNSPILRLVKELSGLSKFENVGAVKKTLSASGISDTLRQVGEVLISLLRQVIHLLPRCRLRRLEVDALCADDEPDEAAFSYGQLCAAVYPLVGIVDNIIPIYKKRLRLNLRCDYEAAASHIRLTAVIRAHVGPVLLALWRVVLDEARAEAARRKPAQSSAKKSSSKST